VIDPVLSLTDAEGLVERSTVSWVDVRWYLDGRDGRAAFEAGHIPGAVWADLDHDLAGTGEPGDGRHPLPTPEAFAAAMGALGISRAHTVIAYDDSGGMSAGRLVVMLRSIGVHSALLDGGLASYVATGRPLTQGPAVVEPAVFEPTPWPADRFADADDMTVTAGRVMIDARSRERFTGEQTAIDPRPGHIPGSRNAPWNAVLDDTGRFKPRSLLAEHFSRLGIDATSDVIASCGSGVSACMNVLALERAGLPTPRLFVSSWSGWSSDPHRPSELGDPS
jgi:thiosulfate/3-mercaptopyruvate sulfurtransferase